MVPSSEANCVLLSTELDSKGDIPVRPTNYLWEDKVSNPMDVAYAT